MRRVGLLAAAVAVFTGCEEPYSLTVSIGLSSEPGIAVFADTVQISDGSNSVPQVREFESYDEARDAPWILLTLYRGGTLEHARTVGPGFFCNEEGATPVEEWLGFGMSPEFDGTFILRETGYYCRYANGEADEVVF